jgi:hypothetical protein
MKGESSQLALLTGKYCKGLAKGGKKGKMLRENACF